MSFEQYNNCYELTTPFPKRLLFQEIVYADDSNKTSLDLARKEGIKYFKPISVFHSKYRPNVNVVVATIRNNEKEKWKRVMQNLYIYCRGKEYLETCEEFYEYFKGSILPDEA